MWQQQRLLHPNLAQCACLWSALGCQSAHARQCLVTSTHVWPLICSALCLLLHLVKWRNREPCLTSPPQVSHGIQLIAHAWRQGNTSVQILPADAQIFADHQLPNTDLPHAASLPKIAPRKWCGLYAISSDRFSQDTVGAKSLNTQKLEVHKCMYRLIDNLLHKRVTVRCSRYAWTLCVK